MSELNVRCDFLIFTDCNLFEYQLTTVNLKFAAFDENCLRVSDESYDEWWIGGSMSGNWVMRWCPKLCASLSKETVKTVTLFEWFSDSNAWKMFGEFHSPIIPNIIM